MPALGPAFTQNGMASLLNHERRLSSRIIPLCRNSRNCAGSSHDQHMFRMPLNRNYCVRLCDSSFVPRDPRRGRRTCTQDVFALVSFVLCEETMCHLIQILELAIRRLGEVRTKRATAEAREMWVVASRFFLTCLITFDVTRLYSCIRVMEKL